MMRVSLVLSVALAACAGKLPETRYYQLAAPTTRATAGSASATLAIEPLETDPAYDDERIVYRLTPYRLDYYNYHRWSSAPGTLIADFLERTFEQSGKFRTVTREATAAPVTLGGRVVAIEEVDRSKSSWVGRVVVELRLTDSQSGAVLWTEQYEELEPLAEQTPEGLAHALSVALRRVADRALPIVSNLAAQTARSANATPSRAARLRE
jgi:cholesterol transport system auxiliary component